MIINKTLGTGKKHFIIIVAEGVGGVDELAARVEKDTGMNSRAAILGYVQRGGSPSAKDRIVASQMGYKAVQLLIGGASNRVLVKKDHSIQDFDIQEALRMKKPFNEELYQISKTINI